MKTGVSDVDLTPVSRVSDCLDAFGTNFDDFSKSDVAGRCLLWAGARVVSRKSRTEQELFSVVREMAGSTRNIRKANGKLDRTHEFIAEVGRIVV
jgi:hypothetical protein